MVMTWIAGGVQAVVMRGAWARRVRAHDADPILRARHRLERRDELRELAARDPRLARVLDLPADVVEDMRDRAIFIRRA